MIGPLAGAGEIGPRNAREAGAISNVRPDAVRRSELGFEQFVANTARNNGFAYGLVTAMMALMTGWMASIVFRKD